jgi:hypothetical protein
MPRSHATDILADQHPYNRVPCFAQGCHHQNTRTILVRLTPQVTVPLVLCITHEELLNEVAGVSVHEELPPTVPEDRLDVDDWHPSRPAWDGATAVHAPRRTAA